MDDPRCVDGATTEAGHPVTSIDTVILSDKVLHTVTADVDPSAVEDACISSDGFVATTVGHQTLSDMGPAAVASGREELDIRMKLLAEKLRQDKEEALKRNKATKGFKVSLRQCLKQKAGADTNVNGMLINTNKTKEMVIYFGKQWCLDDHQDTTVYRSR